RLQAGRDNYPNSLRSSIRSVSVRISAARASRREVSNIVACGSPKVRLPCIFNDFIKLPDARTGDAIRRLRRFQSPLPNSAGAWLSAGARPSRALNGFVSDDNIGSSFSISGGDDFH